MQPDSFTELPPDLPVPMDDGACAHLPGMLLPDIPLRATSGECISLATLPGRTIVYAYPMTGRPGVPLPPGWDQIPGARGCTPQACGFRDHHAELARLRAGVVGLSTQPTDYQQEVHARLHLPFPLLSDADFAFTRALRLPTFTVQGVALLRRLTLVCRDGIIEHVFYPIFPPDRHAGEVVAWLSSQAG